MNWLVLALFSAFCLASADAVTKRFIGTYTAYEIVLVRFGAAGVLLCPVLFFQPWPHLDLEFWFWLSGLLPVEMLAMWLYMEAIRESALSLTLPLLAFTPVFNTLTAYLILGETAQLTGFLGILIVVTGSWALNSHHLGRSRGLNLLAPFRGMLKERGPRLMLLVAALYSLTSVFSKGILRTVDPGFFGAFYFVLLAIITMLIFALKGFNPVRILVRKPLAHMTIGFCMAGMVLAHFYAIEQVQVAYMIAVKRTSLLFGMLYGACLFGEKDIPRKLVAGCLMIFGVFLISM